MSIGIVALPWRVITQATEYLQSRMHTLCHHAVYTASDHVAWSSEGVLLDFAESWNFDKEGGHFFDCMSHTLLIWILECARPIKA